MLVKPQPTLPSSAVSEADVSKGVGGRCGSR